MRAKSQAYLPHESATDLALSTEREAPESVVFSLNRRMFKPLEEISEGDYVVAPQAKFSRREQKRLRMLASARYNIAEDAIFPLGFLGIVALALGAAFTIAPGDDMNFLTPLIVTIASASFLAGLFSSPFIFKKMLNRTFKKHGFLKFPKLKNRELSNSDLTYEQIYRIAQIGNARSKLEETLNEISYQLNAKEEQMKSARILKEMQKLYSEKALVVEKISGLTDKISAIVAEGTVERAR